MTVTDAAGVESGYGEIVALFGDPGAHLVLISPDTAMRLLAINKNNRHIRDDRVNRYAADMAAGNWLVDGSTIKVTTDGVLIDGQHRLLACVKAGIPFSTYLVTGLAGDAREAVDTGATRTLGDLLHWRGEKNYNALAATIRLGWRYDNGALRQPRYPSNAEALSWLDSNESIRRSVELGPRARSRVCIPVAVLSLVHHGIARTDPADADAFLEKLSSGAELSENDPILQLRRWADRAYQQRGRPETYIYLAVTIKASNYWRAGKSLGTLRFRMGGASPEAFPQFNDPV